MAVMEGAVVAGIAGKIGKFKINKKHGPWASCFLLKKNFCIIIKLMNIRNFFKLAVAIVVSELAGIIGSVFTMQSIPIWYASLEKPALSPPNWIFGPVWTTLYFLMGVAAFLVWRYGFEHKEVKITLVIFCGQLVLNVFWSIIFFGLHNPFWAFIEIIVLWLAIFWTIVCFYKISRPSALLLLPYIFWVSFAAYLNYTIWLIN